MRTARRLVNLERRRQGPRRFFVIRMYGRPPGQAEQELERAHQVAGPDDVILRVVRE